MIISKVEKDSLGCYLVWEYDKTDFSFLVFEGIVFEGGSNCLHRGMVNLENSRAVLAGMVDLLWEVRK